MSSAETPRPTLDASAVVVLTAAYHFRGRRISSPNHRRLANLSQCEAAALGPQGNFSPLDGLAERSPAQLERLMMHRHEHSRAGRIGHGHGLFRRAVVANPGVVCADRHNRGFERAEA